MIAGLRVLAVVPARSGSKGIPDKNMQRIGGTSLIGRAGLALRECPSVDRAIISTDSPGYAAEGSKFGLEAPFLRPAELSSDTAGAVETMIHAIEEAQRHYDERYGFLLIVEPTCPLRTAADIEGALQLLVKSGADSVVTVSKVDSKYHPKKVLKLDREHLAFYETEGATVVSRQTLSPVYCRNGACYALRVDCLLEQRTIFPARTRPYLIERVLVNIDEPVELEFARFLDEVQVSS